MTSDQHATGPAPRFPIYLLPSFNLPFRGRRQRPNSPTASYGSSGSPPVEHALPSLSSSPDDAATLSGSPGAHTPPPPPYLAQHRLSLSSLSSLTKDARLWGLSSPSSSPSRGSGWSSRQASPSAPRLARAQPDTIRCSTCATDLAFTSQIVSKGFTGRYGRAYLVAAPPPPQKKGGAKRRDRKTGAGDLINVRVGKPETRLLVTGSHVVADISCAICHAKVGWKYVDAKEEAQKYKVGKFILETQRVVDHRAWEDLPADERPGLDAWMLAGLDATALQQQEHGKEEGSGSSAPAADETDPALIVFDSEDEDECEDIFAGTWDPEIVARRRSRKVHRRAKQS